MRLMQQMLEERANTIGAAGLLLEMSEKLNNSFAQMNLILSRMESQLDRIEKLEVSTKQIIVQEISQDREILKTIKEQVQKEESIFIPSFDLGGEIFNKSDIRKTIDKDLMSAASKIKEE